MIELLAALVLQTIPELPVLTIPRECPEDAENCVMVYAEWEAESQNLPVEYAPLTVVREVGMPWERVDWLGLSVTLRGRLFGANEQSFEVRFQNSTDYLSPCGGLGTSSVFWPFTGFSETGHPLIFTDQGVFEITSQEPQFGWNADLVLVDANTLEIVDRIFQFDDWDRVLIAAPGEYFSYQHGVCVHIPTSNDPRIDERPPEFCEELARNGGEWAVLPEEDPSGFNAREREYNELVGAWDHAIFQSPNLPGILIIDGRIACT